MKLLRLRDERGTCPSAESMVLFQRYDMFLDDEQLAELTGIRTGKRSAQPVNFSPQNYFVARLERAFLRLDQ